MDAPEVELDAGGAAGAFRSSSVICG